ncbi:MAG: glycoside hydrolase family 25 protein [Wujia sp.]
MKDYRINWARVILVGASALILILIGVIIGVNIGKKDEKKPVFVNKTQTLWTMQQSEQGRLISDNFWRFARASYILIGEIPNCEFYKIASEVPRNTYDVESYQMDEGASTIMRYSSEAGGKKATLAVDVSSYQTAIDWNVLKQAGVTVAIVRAGYRGYGEAGRLVEDDMFRNHIEGAKAAGLKVGIYFFSQALNYEEGVEEANFAISLVSQYNPEMPIIIDSEEIYADDARTKDLTVEGRTDSIVGFCETVKAAGYQPMIYSNRNWFAQSLDMTRLGTYPLWLAHYSNQPDFPYWYDAWQYTGNGAIEGFEQEIDMNVWFE